MQITCHWCKRCTVTVTVYKGIKIRRQQNCKIHFKPADRRKKKQHSFSRQWKSSPVMQFCKAHQQPFLFFFFSPLSNKSFSLPQRSAPVKCQTQIILVSVAEKINESATESIIFLWLGGARRRKAWAWKYYSWNEPTERWMNCQIWDVWSGDRHLKCFWVIFALCSQPHLFLCRIYIQSRKLYISFIYLFFIWRSMSVYICAQLSNDVRNIPVKASSVCICMCVCAVWVCSSATRCCVLLLLSCCHRNIVVAKLLLLPSYLISCSPFPQWLRTRPLPTHVSPIPPTGCWWFCSSMVEEKIDPCRLTFK